MPTSFFFLTSNAHICIQTEKKKYLTIVFLVLKTLAAARLSRILAFYFSCLYFLSTRQAACEMRARARKSNCFCMQVAKRAKNNAAFCCTLFAPFLNDCSCKSFLFIAFLAPFAASSSNVASIQFFASYIFCLLPLLARNAAIQNIFLAKCSPNILFTPSAMRHEKKNAFFLLPPNCDHNFALQLNAQILVFFFSFLCNVFESASAALAVSTMRLHARFVERRLIACRC